MRWWQSAGTIIIRLREYSWKMVCVANRRHFSIKGRLNFSDDLFRLGGRLSFAFKPMKSFAKIGLCFNWIQNFLYWLYILHFTFFTGFILNRRPNSHIAIKFSSFVCLNPIKSSLFPANKIQIQTRFIFSAIFIICVWVIS